MFARLALAVVAAMLWSGVATADIIDTTGDAVEVAAPLSVVPPDYAEDGVIHAFEEQFGVALPSTLTADMTVHYTTYNPPSISPWTPATTGRTLGPIAMGTVVNSYYIHFDPVTFGGVSGAVTFDEPIIAVFAEGDESHGICKQIGLDAETAKVDPPGDTLGPSNVLGDISVPTDYPDGDCALGIENGPDRIKLYESSVWVAFGAGSPGDRVRVLTNPAGTVLCGNGVLDPGEGCDDGNIDDGDGCFGCQPETCNACTGAPSVCTPIVVCTGGDDCCAPGCTPTTDSDCRAACTVKKIKYVMKKKKCLLKLFTKAAKSGVLADPAKLNRCALRFDFKFFKEELKGGCQTRGDAPALEAKVDAFVADVKAELDDLPSDDENACRARKLSCIERYDACVFNLYPKATRTGFIDPVKKAKCDSKLADCWADAELDGGCETTMDLATIQGKDDAFIDDVTCELQVCLP